VLVRLESRDKQRGLATGPKEGLGVYTQNPNKVQVWGGERRDTGSKENYLVAVRDFQAVTHDCFPRKVPESISCRPEPGGLCTVCDNWLHSLKNPNLSQMRRVKHVCLVLTKLSGWHLAASPPFPCPRF
jgi:hypothetical protein